MIDFAHVGNRMVLLFQQISKIPPVHALNNTFENIALRKYVSRYVLKVNSALSKASLC